MEVSVVIPVFNEADCIGPLVRETTTALQGLDHEVIVVDDGSTDDTPCRLHALRHTVPTLRVVTHVRNFGQSAAIASGVRAARSRWIATLDGDGQNDPADIPRLYALARQQSRGPKPVLVVGNRTRRNDNRLRLISSRLANAVRRMLLDDGCRDTGCGLKVFRRDAFLQLPHFDHLHRFLPALFKRAGGIILETPVNHRPRAAGQSKYGIRNRLWVGVVDMFGVMWLLHRPCRTEWKDKSHAA